MDFRSEVGPDGPFDARYLAFLETITNLRPSLHRYCARMLGSVMDGEDVVQESLFQAYRKLDTFDDTRPLASWLFRIAHRKKHNAASRLRSTDIQANPSTRHVCVIDRGSHRG
jgi:RNA polymerase sigma-70 factor, ECF subfamily